jgi:hypothetical protein
MCQEKHSRPFALPAIYTSAVTVDCLTVQDASFQRQKLLMAMDKLQANKNWSLVASKSGHVKMDAVMQGG